ncbi:MULTISPECIES: tRNA (N(6)-L-threonylcarbamoyladenosine(37)-C(2))-methylthiotransferase MtaB [unclassified Lebetimonas]|uniref:tRNA (N(6)-L-threonylcarbamoyladenosine(37)-C(2))- methylthiotransferase MtaB n=1 Tax=unclassified Lebetimonas TaxID=2648158 RepID=UPI00046676E2|nr:MULTISPECIES: tRNA (N(6)-L-threonylcarbamoyladenosine(37)-C(2))-methylthiotransferase MtaB [unclassified Lebetimonas]
MNIFIKTFGCRSNIYDSELMKNILKKSHVIADNEEKADLIIINSCTVTNFADRDVRSYINKWQNKKIVFTGCGAYTQGEKLFKEKKINAVLGHKYKEEIDKYLNFEGIELGDFDFVNKKIITDFSTTKAFVKIQEGCDFECAYCILPKVRGYSRSLDEKTVIEQIKYLSQTGINEIVLTGINMGSYGKDTGSSLAKLIKKILKIGRIKRIRIGSLEPTQIDEELIEIASDSILEKHFHIALQHTSDTMLRIMKRRNRVSNTLPLFEKLATYGFALGTDIIVGHPGESEKIWEEAFNNFKKYPLTHLHVFRFTPRDGTISAAMKQQIRGDITKKRAKILHDFVQKTNYNFRKRKNELFVHIEEKKNGFYQGFDEYYNKMLIKSDKFLKGEWVRVKDYEVKEVNYAKI